MHGSLLMLEGDTLWKQANGQSLSVDHGNGINFIEITTVWTCIKKLFSCFHFVGVSRCSESSDCYETVPFPDHGTGGILYHPLPKICDNPYKVVTNCNTFEEIRKLAPDEKFKCHLIAIEHFDCHLIGHPWGEEMGKSHPSKNIMISIFIGYYLLQSYHLSGCSTGAIRNTWRQWCN